MDSKTLPIINTPRVVLRWISEDDIDSLYEIFSDPQVMRYWSTVPLPNREAAAELQREIAVSPGIFTPKAFANFSPGLERSDNPGLRTKNN